MFEDEYNLNPGLEWEDEFTGRSMLLLIAHPMDPSLSCLIAWPYCFTFSASQYQALALTLKVRIPILTA